MSLLNPTSVINNCTLSPSQVTGPTYWWKWVRESDLYSPWNRWWYSKTGWLLMWSFLLGWLFNVELPLRLTLFWIISSQISSNLHKFLLKFSISSLLSWYVGQPPADQWKFYDWDQDAWRGVDNSFTLEYTFLAPCQSLRVSGKLRNWRLGRRDWLKISSESFGDYRSPLCYHSD